MRSRAKGLRIALSLDNVFVAAGAASSKTVDPTVVLDVGDLLGITDHFVITSGSNVRQVRTIAEEVELLVKAQGGGSPRYVEGLDDARWVLLDYGRVRRPRVLGRGPPLLRPRAPLVRRPPRRAALARGRRVGVELAQQRPEAYPVRRGSGATCL